MKEDIITNNFIGDDGFGDMFEGEMEPELARAGSALEEPLYQANDISKLSTIEDAEPKTITDSTLDRSKLGEMFNLVLVLFFHAIVKLCNAFFKLISTIGVCLITAIWNQILFIDLAKMRYIISLLVYVRSLLE